MSATNVSPSSSAAILTIHRSSPDIKRASESPSFNRKGSSAHREKVWKVLHLKSASGLPIPSQSHAELPDDPDRSKILAPALKRNDSKGNRLHRSSHYNLRDAMAVPGSAALSLALHPPGPGTLRRSRSTASCRTRNTIQMDGSALVPTRTNTTPTAETGSILSRSKHWIQDHLHAHPHPQQSDPHDGLGFDPRRMPREDGSNHRFLSLWRSLISTGSHTMPVIAVSAPPDVLHHPVGSPPVEEGPRALISEDQKHSDHGVSSLIKDADDLTGCIKRISGHRDRPGGFADIVYGQNTVTGELVAIKCLRAVMMDDLDPASSEAKERLQKRLQRELRVLKLAPHPRVIPLSGHAVFEERPALVTPWYSGGSLIEYISNHRDANRMRLVCQVGEGIAHLHSLTPPIAHCDIKPANVLVDDDGDAALSDFGLATLLDNIHTGLTTSNDPSYSVRYCAPELLDGGSGTPMADVYAFACLAFEVLTEKPPFYEHPNSAMLIVAKSKAEMPNRWECAELSNAVWLLLERCWASKPEERPTMEEVMQELVKLG